MSVITTIIRIVNFILQLLNIVDEDFFPTTSTSVPTATTSLMEPVGPAFPPITPTSNESFFQKLKRWIKACIPFISSVNPSPPMYHRLHYQ